MTRIHVGNWYIYLHFGWLFFNGKRVHIPYMDPVGMYGKCNTIAVESLGYIQTINFWGNPSHF